MLGIIHTLHIVCVLFSAVYNILHMVILVISIEFILYYILLAEIKNYLEFEIFFTYNRRMLFLYTMTSGCTVDTVLKRNYETYLHLNKLLSHNTFYEFVAN